MFATFRVHCNEFVLRLCPFTHTSLQICSGSARRAVQLFAALHCALRWQRIFAWQLYAVSVPVALHLVLLFLSGFWLESLYIYDVGKSAPEYLFVCKYCWVQVFPVAILATFRCIFTAVGEQLLSLASIHSTSRCIVVVAWSPFASTSGLAWPCAAGCSGVILHLRFVRFCLPGFQVACWFFPGLFPGLHHALLWFVRVTE